MTTEKPTAQIDPILKGLLSADEFLSTATKDVKESFVAMFHALRAHEYQQSIRAQNEPVILTSRKYKATSLDDIQVDIHPKAKSVLIEPPANAFSVGWTDVVLDFPATTQAFYLPLATEGGRLRIIDSNDGDIFTIYQLSHFAVGPVAGSTTSSLSGQLAPRAVKVINIVGVLNVTEVFGETFSSTGPLVSIAPGDSVTYGPYNLLGYSQMSVIGNLNSSGSAWQIVLEQQSPSNLNMVSDTGSSTSNPAAYISAQSIYYPYALVTVTNNNTSGNIDLAGLSIIAQA